MPRLHVRHVSVAAMLILALLGQGTLALAGTTGGISGTVVDADTSAPIADAKVTVSAPAQTASAQTDAAGHFTILSLTPETYTVSVEKQAYDSISRPGISVFADTVQRVAMTMHKTLKTIAQVRSANSNLVARGTTADVYSVNAATQDRVSALGGGGALNSAYSAVQSVPGATMPFNQSGYYQTVHIRGGDYDQVGFEFDGVPVNRSFDNYPSGQMSSLGMSELQVYTGATPANSEGQGLAGYINQVIKTGTYPGFGTIYAGIGTPTFYHKLSAEAGGASPNRLFSYYVGIGSANQAYRYVDNSNGNSFSDPFSGLGGTLVQLTPTTLNPDGTCTGAATDINFSYCYANGYAGPGNYLLAPITFANQSSIFDRDVVVNVHFGLPHRNDSGRDDVQILWDSAMLLNGYYSSANDTYGPTAGFPANSNNPGPPFYFDAFQWNGPVGQILPSNYNSLVSPYLYPASPSHQAFSFTGNPFAIDPNHRDTTWNDQEIVKLQYQKNFGSDAYLRLYGYTYYSDWLQNGPVCAFQAYICVVSPDYELSSHTRGVSLSFADQISSRHLIQVNGNYTTANSTRDNNTQMFNAFGSRSLASVLVNGSNPTSGVCYNAANPGLGVPCTRSDASYLSWPCMQSAANPFCDPSTFTSPAAVSGLTCGGGPCQYLVAENSLYATYNTVVPKFYAWSLQDQYRPNERWLLNLGVRADIFQFNGSDTHANDPARQFWFNAYNMDNCVSPNGFDVVPKTSLPGFTSGVTDITTPCSALASGFTTPRLTNVPSQVFTYAVFQPRFSGTYSMSADTVLRFSAGTYVEPPNTAYEQYNTLQENLAAFLGGNFYRYGFTTPGHQVRPPISANYDLSWEQRIHGTDWSFKITPFYRHTVNQIQNFFLDQQTGFISGLNVGRQTSDGIELAVNKGDFDANGISGSLAFTYTNSYINYDTLANGTSVVSQINSDIQTYNAYTSFCATNPGDSRCGATTSGATAAPCYDNSGNGVACGTPGSVANPYWNAPVQALLSPNANYAVYDIFPGGIGGSANSFTIPYYATLILNYKHNRFAITPTFQFLMGNRYGSPETTPGVDPAAGGCATNPTAIDAGRYPYGGPTGASAGYDALNCASTIVIPNPYTKTFDQPGAFLQPNEFLMNVQVRYDVSPKVTLVGTFANVVNTCWGGSKEAWTLNNSNICSYSTINSAGAIPPAGNVYNPGAAIQPILQFPYQAYLGPANVFNTPSVSPKAPFQFFLEARLKL